MDHAEPPHRKSREKSTPPPSNGALLGTEKRTALRPHSRGSSSRHSEAPPRKRRPATDKRPVRTRKASSSTADGPKPEPLPDEVAHGRRLETDAEKPKKASPTRLRDLSKEVVEGPIFDHGLWVPKKSYLLDSLDTLVADSNYDELGLDLSDPSGRASAMPKPRHLQLGHAIKAHTEDELGPGSGPETGTLAPKSHGRPDDDLAPLESSAYAQAIQDGDGSGIKRLILAREPFGLAELALAVKRDRPAIFNMLLRSFRRPSPVDERLLGWLEVSERATADLFSVLDDFAKASSLFVSERMVTSEIWTRERDQRLRAVEWTAQFLLNSGLPHVREVLQDRLADAGYERGTQEVLRRMLGLTADRVLLGSPKDHKSKETKRSATALPPRSRTSMASPKSFRKSTAFAKHSDFSTSSSPTPRTSTSSEDSSPRADQKKPAEPLPNGQAPMSMKRKVSSVLPTSRSTVTKRALNGASDGSAVERRGSPSTSGSGSPEGSPRKALVYKAKFEAAPPAILAMIEHLHAVLKEDDKQLGTCSHEGLFRISGLKTTVESVIRDIENGKAVDLKDLDINDVTSLLKQYFRELGSSLFAQDPSPFAPLKGTPLLGPEVVAKLNAFEGSVVQLREAFAGLAPEALSLLKKLLGLLHQVAARSGENHMTPKNLVICWGPTLTQLSDCSGNTRGALEYAIEHYPEVFPADTEQEHKKGRAEKTKVL